MAPGKNLTVWSVHTVISDLTLNGAGNTTITGMVDGGGAANAEARARGQAHPERPGVADVHRGGVLCGHHRLQRRHAVAGHDRHELQRRLDLNGPLLQVGASSTVSGGALASGPLGVGTLVLSSGTLQDDGGGRTLATAINIDGNVTLAGAGSVGVSFAPLGLSTPNVVTMINSPTITVMTPTTMADPIAGSSGFTMSGPSVLTLAASTTYLGGTITVSGGTLQGAAASILTPVVLANNANVTYNQNTSGTLIAPVSGNGSFLKTGSGVLTLGAASSYAGATTINAGTLRLAAPARTRAWSSATAWMARWGPSPTGQRSPISAPTAIRGAWSMPGQAMWPASSAKASNSAASTSWVRL